MGIGALGVLGSSSLFNTRSLWADNAKKPNIVFLLIDDMGWKDLGCYGNKFYETPNIDKLASQGMKFTDAYAAAPLCSATRASILSGKYPARVGITGAFTRASRPISEQDTAKPRSGPVHEKLCSPRRTDHLPLEEITFAELMKDAGYKTAFFGKWHLGHEPHTSSSQGFDHNIGGGWQPGPPSYFDPYRLHNIEDRKEGEYLADRLTDEAEQFLEENKDDPFLLYLSHYSVHTPIQGKEDLTEKYRKKIEPGDEEKNPVYAAMVQSVDESVGSLMAKLEELNLVENTFVLLMSDNGGLTYEPRSGKFVTSNKPLRAWKATLYEGGIREPMIVRWPGVVEPGSISDEPVSSVDFYPTFLEVAGVAPHPKQHLDGESLVPLLANEGFDRDAIFWHFPHYIGGHTRSSDTSTYWITPCAAVRMGDYKLIEFFEGRVELYNLKEDIGEKNDLSKKMPERAEKMKKRLDEWLEETGARMPVPNPNYNPALIGWTSSNDCRLEVKDGVLKIKSVGGDPWFHTTDPLGLAVCPDGAILKIRMKCKSEGPAQAFWTTYVGEPFHHSRRVDFDLVHDGEWREYEVKLPVRCMMEAVRLDPGTGPGEIEIEWIKVLDALPDAEKILKEWRFKK